MTFDQIKNELAELPNEKLNQRGFFCTEIKENVIIFNGGKNLVWWVEVVSPTLKSAKDSGIKFDVSHDEARIYRNEDAKYERNGR